MFQVIMSEPTIRKRKLTDYKPDPRNANRGSVRGQYMLDHSVEEVGAARSLVASADDYIPIGNHAQQALADAGITDVIEVETDGRTVVVVKRSDWESINDPDVRKAAILDNRTTEVSLTWDAEALLAEIDAGIDLSAMFARDEIDAILRTLDVDDGVPAGDPGAQLERAIELCEKWQVGRGTVWEIGRHRLMCGDAYSEDDRAELIQDDTPDMLHTDPPYGINIVKPVKDNSAAAIGGAKPFGSTASPDRKGRSAVAFRNSAGAVRSPRAKGAIIQSNLYLPIKGDAERGHVQHGEPSKNQWSKTHPESLVIDGDDRPFDPTPFVDCAPVVILWGGNYFADKLPIKSCWIAWDKREGITRNNFADCELAWTNQDKPARLFHHLWNGLHKGSQHGERRTHPTEKPVALFAEIGNMFSPGGVWLDLFAGTGAQIVAAEQNGATCLAMELEPLYVAVTLDRLERMGLDPRLTSEGRRFDSDPSALENE